MGAGGDLIGSVDPSYSGWGSENRTIAEQHVFTLV